MVLVSTMMSIVWNCQMVATLDFTYNVMSMVHPGHITMIFLNTNIEFFISIILNVTLKMELSDVSFIVPQWQLNYVYKESSIISKNLRENDNWNI